MKKVYRPFIKGTNWALAGLVTLLGFSNCVKLGDDDREAPMYGVPWASLAIKGSVVDKATQQPIPDIEVKIFIPDSIKQYYSNSNLPDWTTQTDAKGEFKLSDTTEGISEKGIPLVVTDVDGEANGSFETDTVYVNFNNAQHIGGGDGWFQGELTATVKVELEAKKADE